MRTSRFCPVIYACIAFFAMPQLTAAQQPAAEAAPLKLEKLEEPEAPAAPIREPEAKSRITETRERGQVTSIRVESGNSTYYIKPDTAGGSALRGDAQRSTTRVPQWKIFEFDWTREPEKAGEAAAQAGAIAPPPAPAVPPKDR